MDRTAALHPLMDVDLLKAVTVGGGKGGHMAHGHTSMGVDATISPVIRIIDPIAEA